MHLYTLRYLDCGIVFFLPEKPLKRVEELVGCSLLEYHQCFKLGTNECNNKETDEPVFRFVPSTITASHSTVPASVKTEPRPALKALLFSNELTAASAASSAFPPYEKIKKR